MSQMLLFLNPCQSQRSLDTADDMRVKALVDPELQCRHEVSFYEKCYKC